MLLSVFCSFVWVNEGFTKLANRKLGLFQFSNIAESNKRLSWQKNARMTGQMHFILFSYTLLNVVENFDKIMNEKSVYMANMMKMRNSLKEQRRYLLKNQTRYFSNVLWTVYKNMFCKSKLFTIFIATNLMNQF